MPAKAACKPLQMPATRRSLRFQKWHSNTPRAMQVESSHNNVSNVVHLRSNLVTLFCISQEMVTKLLQLLWRTKVESDLLELPKRQGSAGLEGEALKGLGSSTTWSNANQKKIDWFLQSYFGLMLIYLLGPCIGCLSPSHDLYWWLVVLAWGFEQLISLFWVASMLCEDSSCLRLLVGDHQEHDLESKPLSISWINAQVTRCSPPVAEPPDRRRLQNCRINGMQETWEAQVLVLSFHIHSMLSSLSHGSGINWTCDLNHI